MKYMKTILQFFIYLGAAYGFAFFVNSAVATILTLYQNNFDSVRTLYNGYVSNSNENSMIIPCITLGLFILFCILHFVAPRYVRLK